MVSNQERLTMVHVWYKNIHGLLMPTEEIVFTARPKIQSQSQIYRYGGSIFCLPHRPNFSDIFDFCLHWVSVVRGLTNNRISWIWKSKKIGLQFGWMRQNINSGIRLKCSELFEQMLWRFVVELSITKNFCIDVFAKKIQIVIFFQLVVNSIFWTNFSWKWKKPANIVPGINFRFQKLMQPYCYKTKQPSPVSTFKNLISVKMYDPINLTYLHSCSFFRRFFISQYILSEVPYIFCDDEKMIFLFQHVCYYFPLFWVFIS